MTTASVPRPAKFDASKLATAPIAPRSKVCGSCGAPVEVGDRFCNACGTPQPGAVAAEPVTAALVKRRFQCKTCGGRLYRFLLNGQTGKASGQKPLSAGRIAGLVAAILAVMLLVVLAFALFGWLSGGR
ncbi:MAG TPA: zinc ribbon domain-containing protein [Pirellulales bacterium]|nr:zinc ribbon domain-containing protein [Pirellulales bacterium]